MKVLVVEDISFSSIVVERFLQSQGHEVLTSKTGREALTHLEMEEGIECVICDLFLPDMNGFQIYQECQRMTKYHKAGQVETPPFILLTSSTSPEHFQQAQVMGFVAALSKPLNVKELKEALLETGKSTGNQQDDSRPKILVIDTKGDNHNALKEIFANSDYRIIWVTAGTKALEYLEQKQTFKLIVCDTQMPDMDIAVFMNRISAVQTTSMSPVILMSHPAYMANIPESAAQKLSAILQYPMNHFELQQRIGQILSGSKEQTIGKPVQNTVLVADDFSFNVTLIKNVLKRCPAIQEKNCKFLTASTGSEALDFLKSDYSIFLVLSDLNMPQFGGIELLQRYNDFIAQDEYLSSDAFPKPHFFLFTAEAGSDSSQQALDAGYEMILNKPLQGDVLVDAVSALLTGVAAPAAKSASGALSLDALEVKGAAKE